MILSLRSLFLISFIGILICGCSGNSSQPVSPDNPDSSPGLTVREELDANSDGAGHYLMHYGYIFVDPDHPDGPKVEIIPVRGGEIHLNILKLLEIAPCDDCFRVVGFDFPEPDKLNIDILIEHPMTGLEYSVFDVRGIMMFNGSHEFPTSGKTISDPTLGDGVVLNPDGYTALYNGSTLEAPTGDYQKYFQGELATWLVPDSDINGYKYFITDDPLNNRNAFYAASSDVQTFSLQLPTGTFVIGYAVDASWEPPISEPVDDPLTDFDLNANCPEPWKIVVTEEAIGDGLTDQGGETKILIDVYDWQGKDTYHDPIVECPEIFDGQLTATWLEDGADYSRYEVAISNAKLAEVGEYVCLVGVEANENNPDVTPWLDLTAYHLQTLEVIEEPYHQPPEACGEADPLSTVICEPVHFTDCGSIAYDGAVIVLQEWDWDNDGEYDEEGSDLEHTWNVPGTYFIMYRVTDSYGAVDEIDDPIEVTIANALPSAVAEANNYNPIAGETVHFDGTGSSDSDCGGEAITKWEWDWDNDGVYDEEGAETDYMWDFPGTYYVQLQVTDDEGETDNLNEPLEINVQDPGSNPVDVTPPWLNFTPYGICTDGQYTYIAGGINGLHIFDIIDPLNPVWVNWVDTPNFAWGVNVTGGYAYVADGESGLLIIDIELPESAYIVATVITSSEATEVAVSEGYAYVAGSDLQIIDVDPPESAYIVSSVHISALNDIAVSGGYVYLAKNSGLQIIDIDPPESAYIVSSVHTKYYAQAVAVSGGYAYVAAGEFHAIDIEPPESAYIVDSNWKPGASKDMAISGDFAYVPDTHGLSIFRISSPESLNLVCKINTPDEPTGVEINGVALTEGYAYLSDCTSGFHIVELVDMYPLLFAYYIKTISTPGYAIEVAVSGGFAYVANGGLGLLLIDIESPESAYIVNSVDTPSVARGVAVSEDYAYVIDSDLQIIDIEPPESSFIFNSVNSYDNSWGVAESGGYVYVANGQFYSGNSALKIFDVEPPESAYLVKLIFSSGIAYQVAVLEGYAYITQRTEDKSSFFKIIDLEPLESASIVKSIDLPDRANGVAVIGGYAYVAGSESGLLIIDIDPVESAYIVNVVDTPGAAWGVVVSDGYAYVADRGSGLQVIDIEPLESAHIVGSVDTPNEARHVAVSDGYAYVASYDTFFLGQAQYCGLRIIKLW